MSLYDYRIGQRIAAEDYPFYSLIQAAMRKADTDNIAKLSSAFPDVYRELYARYHAPGGFLPGEEHIMETEQQEVESDGD